MHMHMHMHMHIANEEVHYGGRVHSACHSPKIEVSSMKDEGLGNHEITICLRGGAVLGPFRGTWSKDIVSDVRELSKDFDAHLQGTKQKRFKYHLHDQDRHIAHTLILNFDQVTAIYDRVELAQH